MRGPKEIVIEDAWTYLVPIYGIGPDGLEFVGQKVITLCRGDKNNPENPRLTGMLTETLLTVAASYLVMVNVGDLKNENTSEAIGHIQKALDALVLRAKERQERGVQGSYEK